MNSIYNNPDFKSILQNVEKPARYTGGEFNQQPVNMSAEFNFAMCFPDMYEVAMSNMGIAILYSILNARNDSNCERCFAPATDMFKALRSRGLPLYALESGRPLRDFDMLGFTLQYEMSYTNILYMLDLAGIPFTSCERRDSDPLIIAGGPCAVNFAPVSDIFDIIAIGDGEDVISRLADTYVQHKRKGYDKRAYLIDAAKIPGVYVPGVSAASVRKAIVSDLDSAHYPLKPLVPNIEVIHNRVMIELFRGCIRGCRFCQAGYIYRPVRVRGKETLIEQGASLIKNTGFDEISFSSLSTGDYKDLKSVIEGVSEAAKNAVISLPSMRLDSFEGEFVTKSRKSSLTFAPEAGTKRLRDCINKNITDEDIYSSAKKAFLQGFSSIKLYFMIGLPTETDEDIDGIINTAATIRKLYREFRTDNQKQLRLSVSSSVFVPKPFTPFQWEAMMTLERFKAVTGKLKHSLARIGADYKYHDYEIACLEAAFARGGRELNDVLISAYRNGCCFDGWTERFNYEGWMRAFSGNNLRVEDYLSEIPLDADLPWEAVDVGVTRQFLLSERDKSRRAETTDDCRTSCAGCGLNCY